MKKKDEKEKKDDTGLLPYPVIVAAIQGDFEAMEFVLQHYESYMVSLSIRKFRDDRGNLYYGMDRDVYDRLRSKLIQAVLKFKI